MKIMGVILAMLSLIFTGCGSLIVKDINSQPISGVKFSTDSKYEVSKEDSSIPGMSPTKKYEYFEATSNELGELDLLGNSFEVGKLSKENYLSLYITKNGEYTMYKIDDYFSDEFLNPITLLLLGFSSSKYITFNSPLSSSSTSSSSNLDILSLIGISSFTTLYGIPNIVFLT